MKKSTRSTVISDTSPEAAQIQIDSLRAMGLEGRAQLTFAASDALRSIVMSGVRSRHPEYDDETVRLAFLTIWLGPELFRAIHPDVEVAP